MRSGSRSCADSAAFRVRTSAFRRSVYASRDADLTIGVLGLIIAFSFTDYGKIAASRSLEESSDRLRTLVLRAQAESMRSGIKFRISFPGTPDPLDPTNSDKEVDVPIKTLQPTVQCQSDPISNPDAYCGVSRGLDVGSPSCSRGRDACRCCRGSRSSTSTLPARSPGRQSATPTRRPSCRSRSIRTGRASWVTFVLTDLPPSIQIEAYHAPRILNVIVDGGPGRRGFSGRCG